MANKIHQVRNKGATIGTQYVKFPGVDLIGFDHPDWRSMICKTLDGALNVGKKFNCDPNVAVAWCSERQRAWVKVDALKHRPKFSESEWRSGAEFRVNSAITMIYYYGDNEKGIYKEPALKEIAEDIKDEEQMPDPDWKDRPRSFSNPANLAAARALLHEPHVP